jgi:hypothetical protein
MSIRLPNAQQVYHCFTGLAGLGARGRTMSFTPPRCALPKLITLDSVRYPGFGKRLPPGVTHARDGNLVTFWYKACHKATQAQIDAAARAVQVQGIPRQRYTGRLVDVFKHNGSLYALLMDVQERDTSKTKRALNFRMMNLDDGNLYRAFIDAAPAKVSAVKQYSKVLAKVKAKKATAKPTKKTTP